MNRDRFCAACAHCIAFSPLMCGLHRDPLNGRPRLGLAVRDLDGPCGPNAVSFLQSDEPDAEIIRFPSHHRVSA